MGVQVSPSRHCKVFERQPFSLEFVTMSFSDLDSGFKKKKPIQTKYRMPLLNWQALRSHQVTGTVFHELDDEMILQV